MQREPRARCPWCGAFLSVYGERRERCWPCQRTAEVRDEALRREAAGRSELDGPDKDAG